MQFLLQDISCGSFKPGGTFQQTVACDLLHYLEKHFNFWMGKGVKIRPTDTDTKRVLACVKTVVRVQSYLVKEPSQIYYIIVRLSKKSLSEQDLLSLNSPWIDYTVLYQIKLQLVNLYCFQVFSWQQVDMPRGWKAGLLLSGIWNHVSHI